MYYTVLPSRETLLPNKKCKDSNKKRNAHIFIRCWNVNHNLLTFNECMAVTHLWQQSLLPQASSPGVQLRVLQVTCVCVSEWRRLWSEVLPGWTEIDGFLGMRLGLSLPLLRGGGSTKLLSSIASLSLDWAYKRATISRCISCTFSNYFFKKKTVFRSLKAELIEEFHHFLLIQTHMQFFPWNTKEELWLICKHKALEVSEYSAQIIIFMVLFWPEQKVTACSF